jgi:hypothetical protein
VEPIDVVEGGNFEDGGKETRRRGRPTVDDTTLSNARRHLLAVAANTWPEIVLALRRVRTPAHLDSALLIWETYRGAHPIIDALLTKSTHPATLKTLRALERQEKRLHQLLYEADERRRRCRDSFEKVRSIPAHQLPAEQRKIVEVHLAKRALALERAEAGYSAAQKRLADVILGIKESRSYIARQELVRFCGGDRYEMTPVNLANALAGSPYLEYRQSIKRCRALKIYDPNLQAIVPLEVDNGIPYHTSRFIGRAVESCKVLSRLTDQIERRLRKDISKSAKYYSAAVHMRKYWYYMQEAIVAVCFAKPRTSELADRIAADYFRRIANRSSVDEILAEDERILIK